MGLPAVDSSARPVRGALRRFPQASTRSIRPVYAASKGGVAGMVLPLARELGEHGIRVMGIAPGVFETPMTLNLAPKSREVVFAAVPPFPRRPGRADEFASLLLAIVANPMLNGEVIRLDGGLRMPARV